MAEGSVLAIRSVASRPDAVDGTFVEGGRLDVVNNYVLNIEITFDARRIDAFDDLIATRSDCLRASRSSLRASSTPKAGECAALNQSCFRKDFRGTSRTRTTVHSRDF